jgi:hypothetical protein
MLVSLSETDISVSERRCYVLRIIGDLLRDDLVNRLA